MEHKKVIVTGGNRGIGKGIVLSLLDQGYLVLATSRDSKKFDMSHKNLEVTNLDFILELITLVEKMMVLILIFQLNIEELENIQF